MCSSDLLSACFGFVFCIVFSTCYHWWICFLVCCSLLSFFFLNYVLLFLFLVFFILITFFYFTFLFYFILFYFILFYFILSFFLFFSLFFGAMCQVCASELGEPSSGHWSTRDLPLHVISKGKSSPRDLHLNTRPSSTQRPTSYSAGHPMPNN